MPVRFVMRRLERFFIYRVLHVDDTPHRIALGVAIGIFIAWTPTIGFQMILTVLLSTLLRANKLVGLPFVWISNPLTVVPIYGPNYIIGCWLSGRPYNSLDFLIKATRVTGGWIDKVQAWWSATWQVFRPLWTGSILVGIILAILTYFTIYRAVAAYRRHWHKVHPPRQ